MNGFTGFGMPPSLQTLAHENLSSSVYAALCDALMKGHFQPGDRLKIRELAEQFGTSVTPVRDAIIRLTHDEALVFQSPRDIRIPLVSRERYLEMRAIRLRLEAFAAEMAAAAATPADTRALKAILEANEKAIAAADRRRGTELNYAFHFHLATIAGLPMLQGIMRRIWLQMGPLISQTYLQGGRSMIDYHYPILEAVSRHDGAAAAEAMRNDILMGGESILTWVTTPHRDPEATPGARESSPA